MSDILSRTTNRATQAGPARRMVRSRIGNLAILLVHLCCLCGLDNTAVAQLTATPLDNMVLDTSALVLATSGNFNHVINGTAFQEDALITHDDYQYTSWYHHNGTSQDIYVSRRNLNSSNWETIDTGYDMTRGNQNWDSHNSISMGISGDGRIHLSYDHHVHNLRYLTTAPGVATSAGGAWNQTIFEPERSSLNFAGSTVQSVTYPRFANIGDDLVLAYRERGSGNGDIRIADYDAQTGQWSSTRMVNRGNTGTYDDVNNNPSPRRNAYHNGFDADSTGRLHTTWTWRESTQDGNHDIMYAYSDDKGVTWRNNDGLVVGTPSSPMNLNSPGLEVVDLDRRQAMINQQGQVVDSEGGVHALMYHRRQEPGFEWQPGDGVFHKADSAYHHYYRDPFTGAWDVNRLPVDYPVGSRPKIGVDPDGHLVGVYVSGSDLIVAGSQKTLSGYSDWEILHEATGVYHGSPQIDSNRLSEDGVLSVFLQDRQTGSSSNPTTSPLRVLEFDITGPTVVDDSVLIAGWTGWSEAGNDTWNATQIASGITAQANGTPETGGVWFNFNNASVNNGASNDGQYGGLGPFGADTSVALTTDGVALSNGYDGYIDFTLTDTTGTARSLTGFHFDTGAFRVDAASDWELEVIAGDITTGSIASGTATVNAGPIEDDVSIFLGDLADSTLEANGSVTFRLNFTGGTGESGAPASGHHLFLDNVGVAGVTLGLPGDFNGNGIVDAADFTVWRDHLGAADESAIGFNGDGGGIDMSDYAYWQANFGRTAPPGGVVPEPNSLSLLLLAFSVGIAALRPRK